jgi:RNA polymerase sigma-70 factor, ECF subfamily
VSKLETRSGPMASREAALERAQAVSGEATGERRLVELCRVGDPHAFGRLVALHEAMVFNLASRLLGDREEARDLAQDVFLQVYRMLGRFEGRSSLRTWIYRITVNLCRNRQRSWRRRHRGRSCRIEELTPAEEARIGTNRPEAETPFDLVRRRERARAVQEALLGLSFDHRAILMLREIEGLSCEEIASTLGLPEGTVKSRLARARERLRGAIEGRLPEEGRP